MSTDVDIELDEKIILQTSQPSKYKVVMVNDDSTPMEWVIGLLTETFKHSIASAEQIMLTIHDEGSGVAGHI